MSELRAAARLSILEVSAFLCAKPVDDLILVFSR
jgi:hypothetical protein